jgi:LysM repeat protein
MGGTEMRQTIAVLLGVLALAGVVLWATPAQAQTNLLFNGGFEGTYVAPLPGNDNINVAGGWVPYWLQGSPYDNARGFKLQPEYKGAFTHDYPYTRVRSGALAQQYFHSYGAFVGGVLQEVNVPRNTRLRFTAWGQAWSCLWYHRCPQAQSWRPAPMYMRIGIDPTGGTDWTSANIVWSEYASPYDAYQLFTVEANAAGTRATVFLYAAPEWPNDDNDVYWDDAVLEVVGSAPPPSSGTSQPGVSIPPGATTYIVKPGDTLGALARVYGTTVAELQRLNNMGTSTLIRVGQVLIIRLAPSTP